MESVLELSDCLINWTRKCLETACIFAQERNLYNGRPRKEGLSITQKDVENALEHLDSFVNKRFN